MNLLNLTHIISILLTAAFSIILSFADVWILRVLLAVSVCILLVVLVIKTSGFLRISYSAFFVLSLLISYWNGLSFENILEAFISNTIFIALFVCTPLIKIPIELGGYIDKLVPRMRDISHARLSPMLIASNFILCSFINLGGVRVIGEVFADSMKKSPVTFGAILSRSFSSAAFWTPYFSAFSIAIAYSSGNPAAILVIGLVFSVIVLTLWSASFFMKNPKAEDVSSFSKAEMQTVVIIIFYFSLLVLSVVMLTHFTDFNVILIISLVSIFFSLLWSAATGKFISYLKSLKKFVSKDLVNIREEAFLFISIGFFANTLLQINLDLQLPNLPGNSPFFVFLFIILFNLAVVGIALTGIHHLVTITIIAATVEWQNIGIEPVIFGMTILLAWWLSSMISPFSPVNMIVARITRRTSFQVGVYSNGLFGIYVLLGGALYLTIINSFLN